jgi:hypothetical protein
VQIRAERSLEITGFGIISFTMRTDANAQHTMSLITTNDVGLK